MINHKYAVETKVYNNGKVEVTKPFKVYFFSDSHEERREHFDYYLEVFSTYKEAKDFYKNCKYS